MADQILDRDKHPAWQGEHSKLVYAFPTNEKLWDKYAQIRADSFRNDGDGREATEFYRQHQKEMDAGAVIAWPERYNADELSAIQHAMNLRLQDERAFWAEYQNEPLPQDEGDSDQLTAEAIAAKTNGHPRGVIPLGASHLTMFIDVQAKLLFHAVVAWEDDFTGYVVDYGTYPDQQRPSSLCAAQDARSRGSWCGLEVRSTPAWKLTGEYLTRRGGGTTGPRCESSAASSTPTGPVHRRGLPVLPPDARWIDHAESRAVCRGVSIPFSEVQRKTGERSGTLAHPERAGPPPGEAS